MKGQEPAAAASDIKIETAGSVVKFYPGAAEAGEADHGQGGRVEEVSVSVEAADAREEVTEGEAAAEQQQGQVQVTVPAGDLYLGGLRGVQHQRPHLLPAQAEAAAPCVGALSWSRGARGAGLGWANNPRQQETLVGECVVCLQKVGVERTLWIVEAELFALQEGLNVSDDV